ncbi:hypothetical protein LJC49_02245 [Ruminococcaceae bacterium OttesenSCG-928-I18]|nr:hypothetical protein [Ruminococcaceae bacterium OttesenSCG-928-I18]
MRRGEDPELGKMKGRLDRQLLKARAELLDFLFSEGEPGAALSRLNADYCYKMRSGSFQLGLVKIDGEYDVLYPDALLDLRTRCAELLRDKMVPLCYDFEVFFEQSTGKMLLNYPGGNRGPLRSALEEVLETMEIRGRFYRGTEFTIALGGEKDTPEGLPQSARLAKDTLAQRIYGQAGTLMDPLDVAIHSSLNSRMLALAVPKLKKALQQKDMQAVKETVDELEKEAVHTPELTGNDLTFLAGEMYRFALFYAVPSESDPSVTQALNESYEERANLCSNHTCLFRKLKAGIVELVAEEVG